jgi:hypothetical protein
MRDPMRKKGSQCSRVALERPNKLAKRAYSKITGIIKNLPKEFPPFVTDFAIAVNKSEDYAVVEG